MSRPPWNYRPISETRWPNRHLAVVPQPDPYRHHETWPDGTCIEPGCGRVHLGQPVNTTPPITQTVHWPELTTREWTILVVAALVGFGLGTLQAQLILSR